MKRFLIIGIIGALGLAACGGGSKIGSQGLTDFNETNRPSASPTPTVKKTPKKSPTPTPTQTQTQGGTQEYCDFDPQRGGDLEVVIKSINTSFEPNDMFVFQGCKVTFKNLDPDNKHSWWSGDPGPDAGKLWKSPALSKGGKFVLDTSKLPPGTHSCHDGEIPYGVVCSLTVQAVN